MLSHLIRQSRPLLIGAALASTAAGVCSVALVALINAALTASTRAERSTLALQFGVAAVGAMLSQVVSSVLFERLGHRAHAEIRRFISGRVIGTELRRLEEIGGPRVQSALSEHSGNVAEFFMSFPTILVNVVIVLGCLGYMAWLSWQVFLAAVLVIGLGSVGYHLAHLRAIRHLDNASEEQDRMFDHFRSMIDGAKELRLNAAKRGRFSADVLDRSIETVRRERTLGMSIFVVSTAWGNFLIYAFIGLVLFALVGEMPERGRIMTGFALLFVYVVSPLESLLMNLPRANLARSSSERIDEITKELHQLTTSSVEGGSERFQSLALRGVCHQYRHESNDDLFILGPIDLSFAPSQITYLVGGNGCGKTTLAKLIVGLYRPEAGSLIFNGVPVGDEHLDSFRQTFSAIFSDFHLFERLLDGTSPELDAKGNELLRKLHLEHKVRVADGAFSTRALSQGQRKRLALVAAYLEERPVLVFDEWAADQDPTFKEVFYKELLPELKAQGKCVLVITHDDRYFGLADRIVRMESGRIMSIDAPARAALSQPAHATPSVAAPS
ncbi:MAG: cyclic peptide export ABC transporter [Polyangiaceae bacterium]